MREFLSMKIRFMLILVWVIGMGIVLLKISERLIKLILIIKMCVLFI